MCSVKETSPVCRSVVICAVLKKLQLLFGEGAVSSSNIVKISRSSWTSDKWAGGASSYPKVGAWAERWWSFFKLGSCREVMASLSLVDYCPVTHDV